MLAIASLEHSIMFAVADHWGWQLGRLDLTLQVSVQAVSDFLLQHMSKLNFSCVLREKYVHCSSETSMQSRIPLDATGSYSTEKSDEYVFPYTTCVSLEDSNQMFVVLVWDYGRFHRLAVTSTPSSQTTWMKVNPLYNLCSLFRVSEHMDLLLNGEDQSQANQPDNQSGWISPHVIC